MATFNDLIITQFKKDLEQHCLATYGIKSKLQSRLREAMEAGNINNNEYVSVGIRGRDYEDKIGHRL